MQPASVELDVERESAPLVDAASRTRHSRSVSPRSPRAHGWGVARSVRAVWGGSRLNWLLLAALGAAVGRARQWSAPVVFTCASVAIVPLAARLDQLTDELARATNPTLGGLVNATFGNVTELILALFALRNKLLRICQASLLGSILSNLLLVLGLAFFAGGCRYNDQEFSPMIATTNAGLLLLSTLALLFPAVLQDAHEEATDAADLQLSRFAAALLLLLYLAYLFFQLRTHRALYERAQEEPDAQVKGIGRGVAVMWLMVVTGLLAVMSDFVVEAVEGVAASWHVPRVFVGVILLPLAGNAAEHTSAVTAAYRNQAELALGIAVGSAIQIALFVTPALVLLAWAMDKPLSLNFTAFETASVFCSVVLCNVLSAQGRSNWLIGLMLIVAYLIVAAGFFCHRDDLTA